MESKYSWLTSDKEVVKCKLSKKQKEQKTLQDGGYGYFGKVITRVVSILLGIEKLNVQPTQMDLDALKQHSRIDIEREFFSNGGSFIDKTTSISEYDAFLDEIIYEVISAISDMVDMPHNFDNVILPTIPIYKIYFDSPMPASLEFTCDRLKVKYNIQLPNAEQLLCLWTKHSKNYDLIKTNNSGKKEFKCTFTFGRKKCYLVIYRNPFILIENLASQKETDIDILNIIILLLYQNNI
jgi:hypothetical protein